jgi:hypothetical protein
MGQLRHFSGEKVGEKGKQFTLLPYYLIGLIHTFLYFLIEVIHSVKRMVLLSFLYRDAVSLCNFFQNSAFVEALLVTLST